MKSLAPTLLLVCISLIAFGQSAQSVLKKGLPEEIKNDWHNLDYDSDKIYGTSANRTYTELIKDEKPKKKIIVAVIDSGVDIEHEDLVESIWSNEDEIPDNGKDDDNNGYVDDVHGWNFLVDQDGNDIRYDNLEATRVLRLKKTLAYSDQVKPDWLTPAMVDRAQEIYDANKEEAASMEQLASIFNVMDSILTKELGKSDYTYEEALELEHSENPMKSIHTALKRFKMFGITKEDLSEITETQEKFEAYYLNFAFEARKPLTEKDKIYGNNHYEGPEADHGTHVAGLIAAKRNNGIGANGIASDVVQIMTIRAVPDGDEHDIDVANAIRYAVDNGANVINMSFGKGLSPHQGLVNDALAYAAEKNVLVFHAAGNDSEDNGEVENYPNFTLNNGEKSSTYVTIGASSSSKKKDLVADFSNYGDQEVDLFAPGHNVYSTLPDNEYKLLSGTSMASPVAAGVAALVWAYHPNLTAAELKQILLDSSVQLDKKKVIKPGTKDKVKFGTLSKTGGVINAYNAFQMASGTAN